MANNALRGPVVASTTMRHAATLAQPGSKLRAGDGITARLYLCDKAFSRFQPLKLCAISDETAKTLRGSTDAPNLKVQV